MSKSFNIDYQRHERVGFPEVIFGASKTAEQLIDIIKDHQENKRNAFITRVQKEKAMKLLEEFPAGFYDRISGVFLVGKFPDQLDGDKVAVLSGGTSDQYLVDEIHYTLRFMGYDVARYQDVGVSGVHRLMDNIEELKKYKVLIVVAGFEGALPTVVGGLLPQPIVAVPASVGYGVGKGGKAALNAMLSSCANGVAVVNIDNGYGAAMAAYRILNLT